jgi:cytochrome c5
LETDSAREFNPNNIVNVGTSWVEGETAGSFHPVLAKADSTLGAVKLTNLVTTNLAWSSTQRNMMTCSDCHGSDVTTDPTGPHGSAASFLLRGPNTKWDNTLLAGSDSMPAGTFCANCHSPTYLNSRFPGHRREQHAIPCFNCHVAIPHGSEHPGLLMSPAGVGAGVPLHTITNAYPYNQSPGGATLYIKKYPLNNGTEWGITYCGCNGTGHGE